MLGPHTSAPRADARPERCQDPSRLAHVLVIDDESNVVELLRRCLEAASFSVGVATDYPSVPEAVQRERPNVVVVGLVLPVQNGLELCRYIREISSARVLMLTTRIDEIDTAVDQEVGADEYLGKPFSPRELVARITSMLDRPRRASPASMVPHTSAAS